MCDVCCLVGVVVRFGFYYLVVGVFGLGGLCCEGGVGMSIMMIDMVVVSGC